MEELISIDPQVLFCIRLVVLIEQEPQSNKYKQIVFNKDQFKKVSDTIGDCFVTTSTVGEAENKELIINNDVIVLPETLTDYK